MNSGWQSLHDELARWRDSGRIADFWWRDDDAGKPTPELDRLCALAHGTGVPLALAVIPALAHDALIAHAQVGVTIVQHGCDHQSRAVDGAKKTEFPATESVPLALERLAVALRRIGGAATLAVLVPPWNRIASPTLLAQLAPAGYLGLSRFGPRDRAPGLPGLVQVNTHVDIIAWHGGRGFVGDEAALAATVWHLQARRAGTADPHEATGVLSHHAVHDEACWSFLARLFEATRHSGAARWRSAPDLFSPV